VRPVLYSCSCAVLPVFAVPGQCCAVSRWRVRCRLGSRVAIYMTNSDRHYFTCSEADPIHSSCVALLGSSPQWHTEALMVAVQVRRAA